MNVLLITGPTASGKTALALALAERLHAEIVNADAFQLYQALPILTAQPSLSERAAIPHHLYSVLDPALPSNAADYRSIALDKINELQAQKKTVILCGGTGLYIKALTHGLDPVPPSDPELRAVLSTRPIPELVQDLCQRDPSAAATIDLQNPRRVIRALEICIQTGQPASVLRQAWQRPPSLPVRGFVLTRNRDVLRAQIARRTAQMFKNGVVDEVRALPPLGETAAKTLGLREIQAYLENQLSLEECQKRIIDQTCQYAKRQETWFRKETWMCPLDVTEETTNKALCTIIEKSMQEP